MKILLNSTMIVRGRELGARHDRSSVKQIFAYETSFVGSGDRVAEFNRLFLIRF